LGIETKKEKEQKAMDSEDTKGCYRRD
jgi:hypothetical protein